MPTPNFGLPIYTDQDTAALDVLLNGQSTVIDAVLATIAPAGIMAPFAGSDPPSGWLRCDGSNVSRTTYSRLFAAIGTTYGIGDGSSTFTLPNTKGRAIVGGDATQSEFNALGKTGGAKTHTLTVAQIPSHTHNATVGGQEAVGATSSSLTASGGSFYTGSGGVNKIVNSNTGGGEAHNNLQPYIVANYIIRT